MAAQHPSYEAESVESPMIPAACGQPGEGMVATDNMHKPRCQDSIPLGSRSPNTESYNDEKTAPEPLLAMKKKAAIASIPYENGGETAIASSISTSETQAAAVPPQRPGHEVNDGVTSRREPGSVKGGPLAAEPSDHQIEGRDEQRREHSGPQAIQAVVMQRNLASSSASLPGAADSNDHQIEGRDEQHQEHSGPQATQAVVMQRNLATPSASLPGAADRSDHQMEGDDENGLGEQRQEHNGPQATQAVVMQRNLARPSARLPGAADSNDHQTEGSEERDRAEPHEEVNRSHSQVLEAAAMLPDSARSLPHGSPRLQQERRHGGHGEDGPTITHDGDGFVVDLRRAREQAGRWRSSNRVCWEENPPVSVEPCGHHIVCPRCFHGPCPGAASSRCPVCCQPIEGYKFNQAMLNLFLRRSSKK